MAWIKVLSLILLGVPLALSHPGEEEKVFQHAAQPLHPRTPHISQCQTAFQEPDFVKRTVARRQNEFERLRKERGLEGRSLSLHKRQADKMAEYLSKDHQVKKPFNSDTKAELLFADDGACMMAPLVSEGPLYVSGEQVRRNLTEGEPGLPTSLDIQIVDAKTCEPIKDAAVDIWGCNTTGIYSGVWTYYRRPDGDATYNRAVINSTALRGIQFTDDDGVAKFDTFFPGHYHNRAAHIHVLVHLDAKRQPNGTITGGRAAHIGQLYFDQALISEVLKLNPYTTNTHNLTLNSEDALLKVTTLTDDPFVRWVKLGDKIQDGVFTYIRLGIDTSASWKISPSAYRDENGGHQILTGPLGDGSQPPNLALDPVPLEP
ncbi:intradiol ring-cleavage dioxygenase-like protein [Podospora aff. communis PSN243]|uniref:Intradiol ring-cleavage dioxygenase-like protein n=1 Tax=Podospora aff. communis PSN243 TaxID=3040156 RepID=A0AAV9GIH7_9PEZI|nr:intradiol ring-cleavage dioxygenase-like protein [Podospora aff. communis PSN243]